MFHTCLNFDFSKLAIQEKSNKLTQQRLTRKKRVNLFFDSEDSSSETDSIEEILKDLHGENSKE